MAVSYARSYKQAAARLGISQVKLKLLIKWLGIQPFPSPVNFRHKILTSMAMARLAEAVEKTRFQYSKAEEQKTMSAEHLTTYRQAALQLDTDERTISGLVRALGLQAVPHPSNGNGRGLDAYCMTRLAIALGRAKRHRKGPRKTPVSA